MFLGIHGGCGNESQFVVVNLAVVLLAQQAVKIIHRLLLNIRLRENCVPHLGKGGIAGPDLSRRAKFGLHRGLVSRDGGIPGLGQMHRADGFRGFNFGQWFAGVEILGHTLDFVHQLLGASEVVHFQGGQ